MHFAAKQIVAKQVYLDRRKKAKQKDISKKMSFFIEVIECDECYYLARENVMQTQSAGGAKNKGQQLK
jgi:hypothetical protein